MVKVAPDGYFKKSPGLLAGAGSCCVVLHSVPILLILTTDRFGRHILGSIYGRLTFFIGFGGSIGPILGGIIYDKFGSYQYLWEINVALLAVISIIILTLKKEKQYDNAPS
jgi:MFS family permease